MGQEGKKTTVFERNPVKTILVLLGIVFFLADIGAGTFLYLRARGIGISHPYYHHGMRAGARGRRDWGGMTRDLYTNSLGFRDASPRRVDPANKAGKKRVLIMGDSFAEGVGVPQEETFPALLQDKLGGGFEVLNAGVASFSPKLYYLRLNDLLERERLVFDRVYLFIDISDIQDEVMYEYFSPEPAYSLYKRLRVFLRDHSLVFPFLYSRVGLNRVTDTEKKTQFELWGTELERYKERGAWLYSAEVRRKWGDKGLASAFAYMEKFTVLCRERGIPVTIVVYPWPEQVLRRDLRPLQVKVWQDFAAKHGCAFLDYFPVFSRLGAPGTVAKDNFIAGDVHWNAGGHKIVAGALYDRVRSDFGLK